MQNFFGHIKCSVCINILEEPMTFACGHSLCKKCLNSLKEIKCTLCGKTKDKTTFENKFLNHLIETLKFFRLNLDNIKKCKFYFCKTCNSFQSLYSYPIHGIMKHELYDMADYIGQMYSIIKIKLDNDIPLAFIDTFYVCLYYFYRTDIYKYLKYFVKETVESRTLIKSLNESLKKYGDYTIQGELLEQQYLILIKEIMKRRNINNNNRGIFILGSMNKGNIFLINGIFQIRKIKDEFVICNCFGLTKYEKEMMFFGLLSFNHRSNNSGISLISGILSIDADNIIKYLIGNFDENDSEYPAYNLNEGESVELMKEDLIGSYIRNNSSIIFGNDINLLLLNIERVSTTIDEFGCNTTIKRSETLFNNNYFSFSDDLKTLNLYDISGINNQIIYNVSYEYEDEYYTKIIKMNIEIKNDNKYPSVGNFTIIPKDKGINLIDLNFSQCVVSFDKYLIDLIPMEDNTEDDDISLDTPENKCNINNNNNNKKYFIIKSKRTNDNDEDISDYEIDKKKTFDLKNEGIIHPPTFKGYSIKLTDNKLVDKIFNFHIKSIIENIYEYIDDINNSFLNFFNTYISNCDIKVKMFFYFYSPIKDTKTIYMNKKTNSLCLINSNGKIKKQLCIKPPFDFENVCIERILPDIYNIPLDEKDRKVLMKWKLKSTKDKCICQ